MLATSYIRIGLLAAFVVFAWAETSKSAAATGSTNILDEPLERLLDAEITSVSKHPETLGGAASAIYLMTGEEVQRTGSRLLVDSLRYVPGLDVAQVNSHTWAVSSRGFNNEYATKLLVLMDGRSVYTPLSAGVYWDTTDLMLEDLDRIEIIRGPGGTLWGANAVNGVINITSKSARDTLGSLVTGGGGNEEPFFTSARYGGKIGQDAYYRFYVKYDEHDDTAFSDGSSGGDQWSMFRTGFRMDSGTIGSDSFTLQGDFFNGHQDWSYTRSIAAAPYFDSLNDSEQVLGANLLGRWTHRFHNESEFTAQTYFDHTDRESNLPREKRDTFDLDLQQQFSPVGRNAIVVGLGYRVTTDRIDGDFAYSFVPRERTLNLFSAFAQDEIALVDKRLRLTLGSKLEHNDFTGFEVQPGVRLAWTPSERQTVWASIARAVRTPSRAEDDVRINQSLPPPDYPPGSTMSIWGNRSGESESLIAYELGYRAALSTNLSIDIASFYNSYDDLRSLESGPPPPGSPTPLLSLYSANQLKGQSWGVEVAADWEAAPDWWRIRAAYTFFGLDLQLASGGADTNTIHLLEGNAPRHQISLQSQMELSSSVQLDAGLRFVDRLEQSAISAYTALDVRLAWRVNKNLELSIVGLNLLDPSHPEYASTQVITPQREVQRSVFAKLSYRF
jgi:iron complex outermembrane receptor protein